MLCILMRPSPNISTHLGVKLCAIRCMHDSVYVVPTVIEN